MIIQACGLYNLLCCGSQQVSFCLNISAMTLTTKSKLSINVHANSDLSCHVVSR